MCRSRAETQVLRLLWYVLPENVILKRLAVLRSRSTFHVRFFSSVALELKRTFWTMICGTRKCYFEAIRSHKVEIDILFEILLNVSLSSWNARFRLTMIFPTRKFYFEGICRHKHFVWDLAQCVAFEPKRAFWTDYDLCNPKMLLLSDSQS